jgi:hypothetical protein
MTVPQILNVIAVIISIAGAFVCFWYAVRCDNGDRLFRLFAGIILLYLAGVYLGAWFGEFYLVKSGILTRVGVISIIALLIAWVIADAGKCRRT